jgi:hypothetical protein
MDRARALECSGAITRLAPAIVTNRGLGYEARMAVVVFGSTLYGKVEAIPGVCHVATRFLHCFFVPLFPTSSWLVVDDLELTAGGEDIIRLPSMHWGSVAVAWLRFFLLAATFLLGLISVTKVGLDRPLGQTLPVILLGLVCAAAFVASYRLTRAKPAALAALRAINGVSSALLARASERLRQDVQGRPKRQ